MKRIEFATKRNGQPDILHWKARKNTGEVVRKGYKYSDLGWKTNIRESPACKAGGIGRRRVSSSLPGLGRDVFTQKVKQCNTVLLKRKLTHDTRCRKFDRRQHDLSRDARTNQKYNVIIIASF